MAISKRNFHTCKKCRRTFNITLNDVDHRENDRGYDPYMTYYIKCPACKEDEEVSFFRLPFHIMKHFVKEKLRRS